MTYEEKVRWLRRYRDALKLEVELRQELEAQRARACKTTAALTGMPGGGGDGQALPRAVESIVAAQQELQAQINLCGATRREVVAALDQVTDARDHEILRRRYLLGQRFEEIAVDMMLEYRWVRRLHKRAVNILTLESPGSWAASGSDCVHSESSYSLSQLTAGKDRRFFVGVA